MSRSSQAIEQIKLEALEIVEAIQADPENSGTGISWTGNVKYDGYGLWYEISADGAENMWTRFDGDEVVWKI